MIHKNKVYNRSAKDYALFALNSYIRDLHSLLIRGWAEPLGPLFASKRGGEEKRTEEKKTDNMGKITN